MRDHLPAHLRIQELFDVALLCDHGLHNLCGEPIRETHLSRGVAEDDFPFGSPQVFPRPEGFRTHLLQPCLWIRFMVFWHFGHMITETAANIWPLLFFDQEVCLPDDLLVVVPAQFREEIPHLVALMGRSDLRVVSSCSFEKPVRMDRVLLPNPSSVDRGWMDQSHAVVMHQCLNRYQAIHEQPASLESACDADQRWGVGLRPSGFKSSLEKVYFSRSRLPESYRKLHEEEELESLLLGCGWTICYPELLSLGMQRQVLARGAVFAGSTSSVFHLLLADPIHRCRRVIVICLDYGLEINFSNQFALQGFDVVVMPCLAHVGDKSGSSRDVKSQIQIQELAAEIDKEASEISVDWPFWSGPLI